MNQSLLFPLVFWDGPPKHDISAICAGGGGGGGGSGSSSSSNNYVVTGAKSGDLCLWKIKDKPPTHHED
eukprot:CAMPEP_0197535306 /NCGR_PEP_ID=MMETSP1318-20131121/50108_1 /TAXON_ID=552666 /ORGANISM="Partenskyella glossopodia, Strain RCC365" /LENGTH=68 /DNA_ID=CAMNT_0043092839 /DNA_START=203 /DNA_END=406 /DNA_ORIENTATION=+